jgi:hypothetical protein
MIEAWASQKSFQRKGGDDGTSSGVNFHGEKRTNRRPILTRGCIRSLAAAKQI